MGSSVLISEIVFNTGNFSPYFMRGILKNMEDVQKLPDEDFPFRKQVSSCLSSFLFLAMLI